MLETKEGSFRIGQFNLNGVINKSDVSDAFKYGSNKLLVKLTGKEIKAHASVKKAKYLAKLETVKTKAAYYGKELMEAGNGCYVEANRVRCNYQDMENWDTAQKKMYSMYDEYLYEIRKCVSDIKTLDAIMESLSDTEKYPLTIDQVAVLKSDPEDSKYDYDSVVMTKQAEPDSLG